MRSESWPSRPHVLSALNTVLVAGLHSAVQELDQDAGTGAIVITGAGDRAFSTRTGMEELVRLD